MPNVGFPSFDQLKTFVAVAETGSFSAAARRLRRAQSVVSYAIAQLEQQLGVSLFDRAGRIPVMNDAGRALLADARRASAVIDSLRARASGLQSGLEAELKVAIDVMFPTDTTVGILQALAVEYPTVSLRLWSEALGGVAELVASGECDLGISTELAAMPASIRQHPIGEVALIPVAAPHCALLQNSFPLAREVVQDATQIVLTDRTALTQGQDLGVLSLKVWRIGDLSAKLAFLRAGLGWGNMPEPLVRDDLAAGRLLQLQLEEGRSHSYPLSVIQRGDTVLGPAGQWLAARFEVAAARLTAAEAARNVSLSMKG